MKLEMAAFIEWEEVSEDIVKAVWYSPYSVFFKNDLAVLLHCDRIYMYDYSTLKERVQRGPVVYLGLLNTITCSKELYSKSERTYELLKELPAGFEDYK